jgi:hypothetical protein
MLHQLALVSTIRQPSLGELTRVAAALQKQIARDVSPMWGLQASIAAFASIRDIPIGYWPVLIMDDIHEPGAAGVHLDKDGRPFAIVQYGPTWSLTASHECLEMLIDPSGSKQVSGPSPVPTQGEVNYLVEACAPSADAQFGYMVDGVIVSDFVTPQYFEHSGSGGRYSFTGAIKRPLEVLKNGYLSWCDPTSRSWYQQHLFATQQKVVSLGQASPAFRCMREFTNRGEVDHRRLSHFSIMSPVIRGLQSRAKQYAEASAAAAEMLTEEIEDIGRRLGGAGRRRRERIDLHLAGASSAVN